MKKLSERLKIEKNGFTLIEILTAMGVFILISVVIFEVFTNSSRVKNRIFASQNIRSELQYAIEFMTREIRMMRDIDITQAGNTDSDITFKNYNCEDVTYCLADSGGNCDINGEYIARNGEIFTSSDVEAAELIFSVNSFQICGSPSSRIQPSITITIEGLSKIAKYPQKSIRIQTTVSPRFYPYPNDYCAGVFPCP